MLLCSLDNAIWLTLISFFCYYDTMSRTVTADLVFEAPSVDLYRIEEGRKSLVAKGSCLANLEAALFWRTRAKDFIYMHNVYFRIKVLH
jgi:hypothetical protein